MRIVTDKYGDKSTEVILALGYLYLPIFIFLVTWINLCISIPVVILLIYALLSLKEKDDCNRIRIDRKFIVIAGLLFVLAIIWTVFSGIG